MELVTRALGIAGFVALAAIAVAVAYVAVQFWWLIVAIALAIVLARLVLSGDAAR